jgi:hypothetical protein
LTALAPVLLFRCATTSLQCISAFAAGIRAASNGRSHIDEFAGNAVKMDSKMRGRYGESAAFDRATGGDANVHFIGLASAIHVNGALLASVLREEVPTVPGNATLADDIKSGAFQLILIELPYSRAAFLQMKFAFVDQLIAIPYSARIYRLRLGIDGHPRERIRIC